MQPGGIGQGNRRAVFKRSATGRDGAACPCQFDAKNDVAPGDHQAAFRVHGGNPITIGNQNLGQQADGFTGHAIRLKLISGWPTL